jgi:hypothetical protein
MKSTEQEPAIIGAKSSLKVTAIVYWIVTALFCLQMSFTVYAQVSLPQVGRSTSTGRGITRYSTVPTGRPRILLR